ncbi:TRAP transporter fused permease subunit [Natrarchaeobius halalkaliphilus]|uniref:TRAP transporter fused permease subunit n=1 Tax=Natrarchaeobius halalkaliphilus TaxID=1679091 RepID=A0A3N6MSY5_9EURY|nr:TRAP transporter fused permease subunit [Natrarchaeobius halalkaliphilus]RQG87885.1 TRAP transporter fused permease subunit [Natrarchaeobius halalkaliphilus]
MSSIRSNAERSLRGVILLLAVGLSTWVIVFAYSGEFIPRQQHANIVLGLGLSVYYFNNAQNLIQRESLERRERISLGISLLFGIAILALTAYVHLHYYRWLESGRLLVYTDLDLLIGVGIITIVIDATFRKYGTILGMVILFVIGYGYFGQYFPGVLSHSGLTVEQIIRRQTINMTGIYGFLLQVGATWIAIFIIFAGLVEGHRGFDFILDFGERVAKHSKNAVVQTAVVSSMIMGTMMGSSASNVATTGSFTIPLMKDRGVPPKLAGAIESVASTGGQILPPIMGTAAFIMADIINVPFAEIAVAGLIPAALFYLSVVLSIHFIMVKKDIIGSSGIDFDSPDDESLSSSRELAIMGVQYVVPLGVLVYVLMIQQVSPMAAGISSIGALLITRFVFLAPKREGKQFVTDTIDGLEKGGKNLAPFMAILASLGIVINIITVTGLAQRIATQLIAISGGQLLIFLVLAMIVSLLFGLGMPTPAAYVLVATIIAPELVSLGVPQLSAHLFVFYFALLSAITPPVALAVAIACNISHTDFLATTKQALVIGAVAFIIPYIFVFNNEIIFVSVSETVPTLLLLVVAIWMLTSAIVGHNGLARISSVERVVGVFVFGLLAFQATLLTITLGLGIFLVATVGMQKRDVVL